MSIYVFTIIYYCQINYFRIYKTLLLLVRCPDHPVGVYFVMMLV